MVTKVNANQFAADGSQYVTITDGSGNLAGTTTTAATIINSTTDAVPTSNLSQTSAAENYIFNGTTWDRTRSLNGASQAVSTGMNATVLIPHSNSTGAMLSTATTVAAGSLILKATGGNLFSVCVNAGASAGYLLIFDSATVPADGTVTPIFSIPVAANGFYTTDWAYPTRGNSGLTLVFSTTGPFTKTISATAFLSGQFI